MFENLERFHAIMKGWKDISQNRKMLAGIVSVTLFNVLNKFDSEIHE